MQGNNGSNPRICLTHPWVVKAQADFAYLAYQLRSVGLEVIYDPIEVRPEVKLWDHIASRITSEGIAGWVYVLTQRFLADRRCRDELVATLDRVCKEKGAGFPLAGLLTGIAPLSLPPALRLRPCFPWRIRTGNSSSARSSRTTHPRVPFGKSVRSSPGAFIPHMGETAPTPPSRSTRAASASAFGALRFRSPHPSRGGVTVLRAEGKYRPCVSRSCAAPAGWKILK